MFEQNSLVRYGRTARLMFLVIILAEFYRAIAQTDTLSITGLLNSPINTTCN